MSFLPGWSWCVSDADREGVCWVQRFRPLRYQANGDANRGRMRRAIIHSLFWRYEGTLDPVGSGGRQPGEVGSRQLTAFGLGWPR